MGVLVREHLATGTSLHDLAAADERLGPDAAALVAPGVGVRQRSSRGGAGPAAIDRQLDAFRDRLAADRQRLVHRAS